MDLTIEELKQLRTEKEAYAGIWKSCHDGSYEMALNNCGYYEITDELKKREENTNA